MGEGAPRQIVCGAWNFGAGATVAVALPGAMLPGADDPLGEAKLRGERLAGNDPVRARARARRRSRGDHGPARGRAGNAARRRAAARRPDHGRRADREPGRPAVRLRRRARGGGALRARARAAPGRRSGAAWHRDRRDPHRRLRRLSALRRHAPSATSASDPRRAWLRARLTGAGMRPISNVVDITNYVMLALGNPLHAFDRTTLAGDRIVVRRAARGEKLRTLDGVERELDEQDLVIADAERAIALAGIMGGEETEVRDSSTTRSCSRRRTSSRSGCCAPPSGSSSAPRARIAGRRASTRTSRRRRRRSPRSSSSSSPTLAGWARTTSTASCPRRPVVRFRPESRRRADRARDASRRAAHDPRPASASRSTTAGT